MTIGLPLYNAERYLDEAFQTLLCQDFVDLEIVVCDNASMDRTWEICVRHAEADPRIRLYRNEVNKGASFNYNRVVELARGELFRWAAYDDLCSPTLLSRCVAALDEAGPSAVLAYPKTVIIDENGTVVGPYDDHMDLRDVRAWLRVGQFVQRFNLCNPVSGLVRTEALRRTGLIRAYLSSDVTLLAELAAMGQFREVPEPLFHRRIHPASSRQGRGSDRRSLAEVAAWFDPRQRRSMRLPRLQLTMRTARALLGNDSNLAGWTRLACAATFATVFGIRRARVVAGRAKLAVLRRRVRSSQGFAAAASRATTE